MASNFNSSHVPYTCPLRADDVFGPVVAPTCRKGFDFTLLFEQTILSIAPSSIFLLLVPLRLCWLVRSSRTTVPRYGTYKLKAVGVAETALADQGIWRLISTCTQVAISLLAGLQLALLILWTTSSTVRTPASVPSAAFSFIGALAIYPLSYLEHTRSIRPSTLLEVYLLASLLLNIPQARTLFLRHDGFPIASVFVASIGAMLVLWMLEARDKTKDLKHPYREYPPEATRGVSSRTFFWWLNSLFVKGSRKLLSLDDLWHTPPGLSSERLRDEMQVAWDQRSKLEQRYALIWACAKCLRWPLLSVVPARLCLIGFNYAQPFLISRIVSFMSEPRGSQTYHSYSLGLVAAAALIYIGIAVSTVRYMHQLYRSITMLRGGLVGLIFNKTLVLRDGAYDESAAVTHMSTDVDRITTSMQSMHEVWARLIEVTIGVWLLSTQLGAVSVVPIVVVVDLECSNPNAHRINCFYAELDEERENDGFSRLAVWEHPRSADQRDEIGKWVPMGGHPYQHDREALRSNNRLLPVTNFLIGYTPSIFAPVLTFVIYEIKASVQGSSNLSTNQAITSLATITLLTTPASSFLTAIPETGAAIGCFERIQKFLVAPSWKDQRSCPVQPEASSDDSSPARTDDSIYLQRLPAHQQGLGSRVNLSNGVKKPAVLVTGMTARPSPTAEPAIFDIDLRLNSSTITILTGAVGSGKSTLMRAVLGELPSESGGISVSSKNMAYCSQSPWILNTTIQRNICGFRGASSTDEQWYQSVMHACALDQDMLQLTDGDQSTPGSRGLTLSGGQKQRVALARAVYSKPDIVLLDDVLSALDGKTERLVADRLLGPGGLFRKLQSTVLLITHSTKHFHHADHIVVLGKSGKISQQGSFGELQDQDGYIKDLLSGMQQAPNEVALVVKTPTKKKPTATKGVTPNDLTDLTRKTGDMAVHKYYFRSISLFGTFCFLCSTALFVFTQFFPQIWLVWWTEANGRQTGKYISVYIVLAFSSWFFRAGTLWWILLWISPRSSIKLHKILLTTAVAAPQSFFAKTDTGVTLNRFSQDIGLIDRILPLSCGRVVLAVFTILAQAALIAQGSSYMGIAVPFVVLAIYMLQKVYLLTSRQLRFLDLEARSPVYTHFLECLEGLSTIRSFDWTQAAQAVQIERLDMSQRPFYLLYCLQRWLSLVLDLMVAAVGIVVVALAVTVPSQSSGAAIGIALNNVLGFNQSLRVLVESWTQLETSLGAVARLKNFEETVVPEHRLGECEAPPKSWPHRGNIEFRSVTASYGPLAPALRNISMTVSPGQKVGICGRTGSGKSSLLLSLFRLIELESGTIVIDGIDISTLPREAIRTRMIAIPQDPFILSDSVRVNVDPFREAIDDAIISALRKVQLWNIIETRGGLDAQMKSQPLSRGQQQLFCLARAMLRKSKILVLDEATSNVDAESDAFMQRILRKEFSEHTIITVAHRLNTISDSDVVAVLHEGRLVEFGPPEELLARPSMFADLYG